MVESVEQQKPIIELKNMSKTFYGKNGEVHALDGIDLTIYEVEIF